MKNIANFLPIIIFVVAVALLGITIFLISDKEPGAKAEKNNDPIENIERIWSKGPADAKVVLVEYSDFQCPACKAVEPIVEKIIKDYSDKVRVEYRHFPLTSIHENSLNAAKASEAAGYQEKFWEMHDKLFANQTALSYGNVMSYAEDLGLDTEKFKRYMNNENIEKKILAQADEARKSGANGTPTFFLNGKKIEIVKTFNEIIEAVDSATKETE